ncbi:hypothetical protein [Fibrella aquatilis]|uniref:Outer membrane protein beta-barrel domain-containing protein n=1 Tax=Fibrella aquatilis TaxID=2817059 RepID=A0A939G684_9BACT|nr:hypothetical protein [Fibrella aquatilis]MBO0931963.1 hypothetical protein [Fibrella aquatilis]
MRNGKLLGSIALLLIAGVTLAQPTDSLTTSLSAKPEPLIPVEVFAAGKGVNFQCILSKRFAPECRFGFLNITTFFGSYQNDKSTNEYISQSFLTAYVGNGISVNAGLSVNHYSGFRPTARLKYVFATKSSLVLLLPRVDLTETHNLETFGLIEYKPKLTKQWGLYTRLQALLNYNTKQNIHERSHAYLRVGASYRHSQLGVGANVDGYGSERVTDTTFGGFLRVEIF